MGESIQRADTGRTSDIPAEYSDYIDVPMSVSIEIGRRTMKVREILQLQPESTVDIPKSAGENVDIFVNGRLLAFGEVLEMEGRAGVRLTDFVEQT